MTLYLHDMWVNWFEGEENGYNVPEFHEWRRTDTVHLLDQVPLFKVTDALYNYIENGMFEIPTQLIEVAKNKAYLRHNHERIKLDCCFIITNGMDALAVDTIGYNTPIRKSRLIPRQFQLVMDMIEDREALDIEINNNHEKSHNLLSLEPTYMYGLTRREKKLKETLMMAVDQLIMENDFSKLRYWYTELNPEEYEISGTYSFEELSDKFINAVKVGFSKTHKNLCKQLIKGKPFLEQLYKIEMDAMKIKN